MGKLGKKARKFARKNLQSVQKRKRKQNAFRGSLGKKRASRAKVENLDHPTSADTKTVEGYPEDIVNQTLDDIFADTFGNDIYNDPTAHSDSESDGLLPEDSAAPYLFTERSDGSSGEGYDTTLSEQNKAIQMELMKQKRKLDRLKKKDPKFREFLENHSSQLQHASDEELLSDEEGGPNGKVLTSSTIASWCQQIMNQEDISVLPNLLNGFRAACHYGSGSPDATVYKFQTKVAFCKIQFFVLHQSDSIFRRLMGMSNSGCKKSTILELQCTSKWTSMKPLVKSYFKSTFYLLTQVTDTQIIAFILSRLRDSVSFLVPFPELQRRLSKIAINLWATGGGSVSSMALLLILDMAVYLKTEVYDSFLIDTYRTFMAHCKFGEPENEKHIQFLADSVVELYSLDVAKSYHKASILMQHLSRVLRPAFKRKNKEGLRLIHDWQYVNCLELWVKFVSANIKEYDLQGLLYLAIQIVTGVAHLFPGPRFLPLRLKCICLLNKLSDASGVFIPVGYLSLSLLEFGEDGKADDRAPKDFNFSRFLKVPKQLLKLSKYREECVRSAVTTLAEHFFQWSYHISFPELALFPLMSFRKFLQMRNSENLRHLVKPFVDQVERNIDFVQRKRDEIAFSPNDQASIESFLQDEKRKGNGSFQKYYASIVGKSLL
ncbi:protein REBELOTE isoform X2 [Nymphaea colorata]|uniref:protein REBELOTE isoform X2 n=1 Tax=Nymphaea colorata TaxID=210225 RepID=UPI00129E3C71|nr:protein REBELOTE isoform X2 [Nymphaea colorata]